MNIRIDFFYFFMSGVALLISVLGLWFTVLMPGFDQWSKRFFRIFFSSLALSCVIGLIEMVLSYNAVPRAPLYLMMVLEPLFLLLPMPLMTAYLLHCCGEELGQSRLFYIVLGLLAIFFMLFASIFFTDAIYFFTPDGRVCRGSLYWLLPLPMTATAGINLFSAVRCRRHLSHKTLLGFLITMLPMAVILCMQMFMDAYPLMTFGGTLSAIAMYGLILSDQIDADLRHQREIANQRASIMVLEMRPHFIYNTMTSIYCLCRQDPEKARQVVLDFTSYLRKNFTAIASEESIPFTAELEHTRAYLAVEQVVYEDGLFVEFDTPHTWFRLPPLTLQPIVENAIKHGRDPYAGPFSVSIRTRKTDSGSEIIVEDNGRGYNPAEDNEPHTALINIRQRLAIMCSGQLSIKPGRDSGTVVIITIPDKT